METTALASYTLINYNHGFQDDESSIKNCNLEVDVIAKAEAEMYYSDLVYCMNLNKMPETVGVEIKKKDQETVSVLKLNATSLHDASKVKLKKTRSNYMKTFNHAGFDYD